MKYCEKVCSKQFSDVSSKQAFQKACKWYNQYFLANSDKFHNISVSFEKQRKGDLTVIKATIWGMLEEEEVAADNCKICKEVHNLFFVNDNYNCSSCTVNAYKKRMIEKIGIKCNYYKEIIRRMI